MSADDHIHAPGQIQHFRQLFIFFQADMRQQNGHIHIRRVISIADLSDFFRRILQRHKGAYQLILFALHQGDLREHSDKENLHSIDLDHVIRIKESGMIGLNIQIGIDDREFRTLFKKQKMRHTVIHLMVSHGNDIRRKHIHDLYRGYPMEFRIYDGTAEHIPRDSIENIFLFLPYFIDIAG